jgi:hypothetical protein
MRTPQPEFVRPGSNLAAVMVNQHAPKYADRRTRRLRDKSGQKRWAIHRSRNDE